MDTAARHLAALDTFAVNMDSLRVFTLAEAGHRSRMGYQPCLTAREFGKTVERIGRMAQQGDKMAYLAKHVLTKINLYGDQSQLHAAVFAAMHEAMSVDFYDVIGATGPEASRPSAHMHQWSLYNKITAFAWAKLIIGDTYGWALEELAEREGVLLPRER